MAKEKTKKIGIGKYLKPHKLGIFLYMLVYAIASACSIATTLIYAEMIVAVSTDQNFTKAIYLLLAAGGVAVLRRLCWWLTTYIYQKVANKIMTDLNYDVTAQAFKLTSKTYADNNTGTFVSRMVSEPDNVIGHLADMFEIITDIISTLVIVVYLCTLNIWIGLVIIGSVIIASIIERYRMKANRKNRKIQREKADKVNSISTEIVRSEKDVKCLGLEAKLSEISKNSYIEYKKAHYRMRITDASIHQAKQIVIELASIGMLILGIFLLDKAMITLATFMLVYSNDNSLYLLVWSLGNILDYANQIQIASERMFSLFDEKQFPAEQFGDVHLDKVKGKIEFKKVNFTFVDYEEAPDVTKMTKKERKAYYKNRPERKVKNTNKIFENLSFKIKPNSTVAFVGKSGSGKSTILNLMSKMHVVDSGQVLIDGVDINDLDKETLRSNISLVSQFPYIFDMSIKENLLLANKDATDEDIHASLAKASLTEFIASLPDGINTKVGEGGVKLSGGQIQRLAIARALLRNSPIIIFDESTSSLDNFAQEDIKRSIDNLKGHGTIVIVAHRLSTIKNADQIFFLDQGKIIDVGTFDELFENNVKFKNMFYAENL